MALRLSALVIILSSLKLSRGALVLPRPPSSPNDINQSSSSKFFDQKLYNVKSRSQSSRTNVEKPNTDDYKLLEIELRDSGGGGPNGINFGEILREVFREEELPVKKEPLLKSPSNKLKSLKSKMSTSESQFTDNEKLYYLKHGRISADLGREKTSWEPRSYLKSVGAYDRGDKRYATKSFYRPKKYLGEKSMITKNADGGGYDDTNYRPSNLIDTENEDDRNRLTLGGNTYNELVVTYGNEQAVDVYTTENSLPTSSELPKQIPPPPSRVPNQTVFAHTTPVLKYMSRRTDILPRGYAF